MLSPIQKTIVNDIDLGKLTELVEEAAVNPNLGFEVTTTWTGQFRSARATMSRACAAIRGLSRRSSTCFAATGWRKRSTPNSIR